MQRACLTLISTEHPTKLFLAGLRGDLCSAGTTGRERHQILASATQGRHKNWQEEKHVGRPSDMEEPGARQQRAGN